MWLVIYSEELHLKSKQEPRFRMSRSRAILNIHHFNRVRAFIFFPKLRGHCSPVREVGVEGMFWIGPSYSLLWPPLNLSQHIQWSPSEVLVSIFP